MWFLHLLCACPMGQIRVVVRQPAALCLVLGMLSETVTKSLKGDHEFFFFFPCM